MTGIFEPYISLTAIVRNCEKHNSISHIIIVHQMRIAIVLAHARSKHNCSQVFAAHNAKRDKFISCDTHQVIGSCEFIIIFFTMAVYSLITERTRHYPPPPL